MSTADGRFVWYELMTTDLAAARTFYGAVVGWGTQAAPVPGVDYTLFTAGGTPVAGLMDLPEAARAMGAPPGWIGYVAVADVDAAAGQAGRLGATLHVPPTDIPEVGRFAVLADPQGAAIALFRPSGAGADGAAAPEQGAPGRIGWHELAAADREAALAFYGALFGWRKAEAVEVGGPVGTYQIFAAAGGPAIGGAYAKLPEAPRPYWLYYVNVADIDAAAGRVKDAGGQVLIGPMQVPGGDWIVQGMDPQGAIFALVGKRGRPDTA